MVSRLVDGMLFVSRVALFVLEVPMSRDLDHLARVKLLAVRAMIEAGGEIVVTRPGPRPRPARPSVAACYRPRPGLVAKAAATAPLRAAEGVAAPAAAEWTAEDERGCRPVLATMEPKLAVKAEQVLRRLPPAAACAPLRALEGSLPHVSVAAGSR